ncbi:MAG: histidine kinase [Clostridiales Family XIII bacterium]|jgi:signal transduction histidine kinase|nr:histidine kinase [Clostridiales Family XIII bacterium]
MKERDLFLYICGLAALAVGVWVFSGAAFEARLVWFLACVVLLSVGLLLAAVRLPERRALRIVPWLAALVALARCGDGAGVLPFLAVLAAALAFWPVGSTAVSVGGLSGSRAGQAPPLRGASAGNSSSAGGESASSRAGQAPPLRAGSRGGGFSAGGRMPPLQSAPGFRSVLGGVAFACVVSLVAGLVFRQLGRFPDGAQGGWLVGVTALFLGFSLYALYLLKRREEDALLHERRSGELEDAKERMQSQRRVSKSVEQVSKLEERNRLAARIHDQIGHGMSGSILLLEGAAGIMDRDPEKAKETITGVAQQLRESVDEIRRMLREERSENAAVSLAQIERELKVFEGAHAGIRTALLAEGDLSAVPGAVWRCVYENLQEALTNTLKHAPGATAFTVKAASKDRLLRVEFSDNGGSLGAESLITKSIGLQNMEERCALCYGRCFFRAEPDGFRIVMTFPLRNTELP